MTKSKINRKKKICVFSGSRAEYGLLYNLIKKINNYRNFQLQLIVTGSHTSKKFGLTYKEIKKDGFAIDKKIEMQLNSDNPDSICASMGIGLKEISKIINHLRPDLMIILGDRYEALSAAIAATINRIPIAHFHGGESTEGLYDEPFRHSITKMSQFHFVAHKIYKKRVLQLGENPKNIFVVGGMGVDNIRSLSFLTKNQLQKKLKINFAKKNLLITFHPVTLEKNNSLKYINQLLKAISYFKDINFFFTMPSADIDNDIIFKKIKLFIKKNDKRFFFFLSLGRLNYLSLLKYMDGVVGNSSSGLLEAPSFKIGTINIGDRQKGRIKSTSVIDSNSDVKSLIKSIKKLYSKRFINDLKSAKNPYGNGLASDKSFKILKKLEINDILKKSFYELR